MPAQVNSSILEFLKANGQRMEAEIADALKLPVSKVKAHVADLTSTGDIICCNVTRFDAGKKIEGVSCRLSCYMPPPARGRKPGVKPAANNHHHQEKHPD